MGRPNTAASKFEEVIRKAQTAGPVSVAIAGGNDGHVIEALRLAFEHGLVSRAYLVGEKDEIASRLREAGIDDSRTSIVGCGTPSDKCRLAVSLAASGEASVLMKGLVDTAGFMKAVLDRERGLRADRLLCQVGVYEVPGFDRLIFIADVGVVVAPDLAQKAEILRNAADVAQALGVGKPKAALLSFSEFVDPQVPASIDAAALAKMADRGQIRGVLVDGPLALDNAVSPEAAAHKGIGGLVAGNADILIVPDLLSGNIFAKSLLYFARARSAGVVVGARVPLVLTSRADPAASKLNSIAVAVLLGRGQSQDERKAHPEQSRPILPESG